MGSPAHLAVAGPRTCSNWPHMSACVYSMPANTGASGDDVTSMSARIDTVTAHTRTSAYRAHMGTCSHAMASDVRPHADP